MKRKRNNVEMKFMLAGITLLLILLIGLYMIIKNYEYISILQKKYLLKYMIFNLILLFNILFLMSERFSQYWYITYVIQIIIVFYFNRNNFSIYKIEDIICLGCLIYCLGLFGYLIFEKVTSFFRTRYSKNIEKQNKFYIDILHRNNKFLNNLLFFRNIIIIRVGSHQVPENPSFRFWKFHSILLVIVFLLGLVNAYKTLLSIAVFCFSISAKYDTLHDNYRDSRGFKKNFDVNTRYWLKKLNNNDENKIIGGVIKRHYSGPMRETIKIAYDKVTVTYNNPKTRTVMVVGAAVFGVGALSVGGYIAGQHIVQTGETTRHKISVDADLEKFKMATEERKFKMATEERKFKMQLEAEAEKHKRILEAERNKEERRKKWWRPL